MNPYLNPLVHLSMGWGRPYNKSHAAEQVELERRAALHRKAVAKRRKAKRGGRR